MSYFETNLGAPNAYFRVLRGFDVFELVGHRPGNHWFGASRVYDPIYETLRVKRGGVVLHLAGGLFYADRPGAPCRPVVLALNDKSPFEKRYSPDAHRWPLDKLRRCDAVAYVPRAERS